MAQEGNQSPYMTPQSKKPLNMHFQSRQHQKLHYKHLMQTTTNTTATTEIEDSNRTEYEEHFASEDPQLNSNTFKYEKGSNSKKAINYAKLEMSAERNFSTNENTSVEDERGLGFALSKRFVANVWSKFAASCHDAAAITATTKQQKYETNSNQKEITENTTTATNSAIVSSRKKRKSRRNNQQQST